MRYTFVCLFLSYLILQTSTFGVSSVFAMSKKDLGETSPPNEVKYRMIHCQGRRFTNFPTNQNTKKHQSLLIEFRLG